MGETPDLSKAVEWARQRLIRTWYQARKTVVEWWRKGKSVAWICVTMNVDRQWVHRWIDRWLEAGKSWVGLRDRSSRPHRIHRKRDDLVDDVIRARRAHPGLGPKKLQIVAKIPLSHDTIHKVLRQHDLCKRSKKRGFEKVRRFERPNPNYLWQLDITQVKTRDEGIAYVATLIDDCTRFVLASKDFAQDLTAGDVIQLVRNAIRQWGKPQQILTDRGIQFWSEKSLEPSMFTLALYQNRIHHITARPRHPRTCGKIERWHRTLKREWLALQPPLVTRADVRRSLDAWLEYYNTVRPHAALDYRLPVDAYLEGLYLETELTRLVNEVA